MDDANPSTLDPRPSLLTLGDDATAGMRLVRGWLAAAPLERTSDLAAADLVVVCLNHPDEFSRAAVDRLVGTAPLARWVVCRSDWCESLGRTRDAWPFAVHVPARLAPARLEAELAVLRGHRPPLPLVASRDEAWEFDHVPPAVPSRSGRVLVVSPDRSLAETWSAVLAEAGFAVTRTEADDFDAALLDGDPDAPATFERIESLRRRGAPIVVASSMPPATVADDPRLADVMLVPKLSQLEALLVATSAAVAGASTTPSR